MKHLLKKINLAGGKKKKPKAKPAILQPPEIGLLEISSSYSYAEILDLISDGPIEGLVNTNGLILPNNNLLQGIYLNDTVVAVSNDSIVKSQVDINTNFNPIPNETKLIVLNRFFKNINENLSVSVESTLVTPRFGYKAIAYMADKGGGIPYSSIAKNDSIITNGTSLARTGDDRNFFYLLKNNLNLVNTFDLTVDSKTSFSESTLFQFYGLNTSVGGAFYFNNIVDTYLASHINQLVSIHNDSNTNKYEKAYIDNIFKRSVGSDWKNLPTDSFVSAWLKNTKNINPRNIIYAIKFDNTNTDSAIQSALQLSDTDQYKFTLKDGSTSLRDLDSSIKIHDFVLPRLDDNGTTKGYGVGYLIIEVEGSYKEYFTKKSAYLSYSIAISSLRALSRTDQLVLQKLDLTASSTSVQKYNYSNILAEYRAGDEFQQPFNYFKNVFIDKNYDSELIGPFNPNGNVQKIVENDKIISSKSPTLNFIPTGVGGSVLEGSRDGFNSTSDIYYTATSARLSEKVYSDWDKNKAAYNESALPVKHVIYNTNVSSVYITILVNNLSDTLSETSSIYTNDTTQKGIDAGAKFPTIVNIEVEIGSINLKGEEIPFGELRKFKILALIESPTYIDIGNPSSSDFRESDYKLIQEYAANGTSSSTEGIFQPFALPILEGDITALDKNQKRYIKVTKLSTETNSVLINKDISLSKVTEIIPLNFSYPHSAIVGTKIDSRAFGSIPTRTYDCKLKKIKVPSNYNPTLADGQDKRYYSTESEFNSASLNDKLIYDGDWDGTFKNELQWTDNPAWILYDLITNERYGLGQYINSSEIDIFDLYKIARFCDAVDDFGYFQGVPDNAGGLEPRFSCNIMFAENMKIFDALNTISALFRGIIYYNNSQINFVDDRPKDTTALFTNTNVKDGVFNYTNYRRDEQFNSIEVVYIDRFDNFLTKVEYVEDEEDIRKRGIFKKTINANGVTSRAMARRLGQHLIFQTIKENQSVSFTSGLESLLCRPGDLIIIEDELKSLKSNFGKVLSVNQLAGSIRLSEQFESGAFDNKLTVYTPTGYSTYGEILDLAESNRSRVNSSGFYLTQGGLGSVYNSHTGFYQFSKYNSGFNDDQILANDLLRPQYALYTGSGSKFCYFSTLFTGWVLSTGFAFSNNNTYDKFIFNSGDHDFTSVNAGSGFYYDSALSSGRGAIFAASATPSGNNSTFRDISGLELQMTQGLIDADISLSSPSQITTFGITGITQYEYGCEVFIENQDINYSLISFVKQGSVYRFQRKLADDQIYKVMSIKEENPNEYSLVCTKFDTGKYALIENDKSIQVQANTYSYTLNQKIGNTTYSVLNAPTIKLLTTGQNSNGFYISGNWKSVLNANGYIVNLYQPNGNTQQQILVGVNNTGLEFYAEGIGNYSYRVSASGSYSDGTTNPNTYFNSDYSTSGLFLIYDGSLMNYDRPYLSSVTIL